MASAPDFVEQLISADRLHARVAKLGADISRDYAGRLPVLVCILRGGVIFLADLIRQLTIPHMLDFMAVRSYTPGVRKSGGEVHLALDLKGNLEGRHTLLVEDIVDTGHTLANVIDLLKTRRPASLSVCSLLDKRSRREVDVPLAYVGFEVPDRFLVGYGLDIDELFREIPFVGAVDLPRYELWKSSYPPLPS